MSQLPPLNDHEKRDLINACLTAHATLKGGAWQQDFLACNENGQSIDPCNREATCWCLEGILQKVTGFGAVLSKSRNLTQYWHLTDAVKATIAERENIPTNKVSIVLWNDRADRSPQDVLDVLHATYQRLDALHGRPTA